MQKNIGDGYRAIQSLRRHTESIPGSAYARMCAIEEELEELNDDIETLGHAIGELNDEGISDRLGEDLYLKMQEYIEWVEIIEDTMCDNLQTLI